MPPPSDQRVEKTAEADQMTTQGHAPHVTGQPPKRGCRKPAVFLMILGAALIPIWLAAVTWESVRIYRFLKTPGQGWSSQAHRPDPELGYAPRGGAHSTQLLAIGPGIPMRYDQHGFRIPLDARDTHETSRPLVLALGCSFTHGNATPAELSYPFLAGQMLGGSAINAGCGAYGLAQMLVLARRLVPEHQPDYLLVQYSPWLVDRAVSPFARSYFGRLTTPYFHEDSRGEILLQPPAFSTPLFDYPTSDYRMKPVSAPDFIGFYLRIGLPMLAREHLGMLSFGLRRITGLLPNPTANHSRLVETVYTEILQIAEANDARPMIVLLAEPGKPETSGASLLPADPGQLVDAQAALFSRLSEPTPKAFLKAYGHWRGSPPTLIDSHPNASAHGVIAETIVQAIRAATGDAPGAMSPATTPSGSSVGGQPAPALVR